MNPWITRIIVIILAIVFLPMLINAVTQLTMEGINGAVQTFKTLTGSLSLAGEGRSEGAIKLCLYLIAGTLLIRYLFGRRG